MRSVSKYVAFLGSAALCLSACGSDAAAPDATASSIPELRAGQFSDNTTIPLVDVPFVPCAAGGAGEYVQLGGSLHVLSHLTISNSGNFAFKQQFQPQGARGTGLTTGDTYHGTGATLEVDHSGQVGSTFTFVNNFRMISTGSAVNFTVHETFHVTVNANGTTTVSVDHYRAVCG
jgi:hypothetical protein